MEEKEPGSKEAGHSIEPHSPVGDDDVERGSDQHEGELTDGLGQVVGRQSIGSIGPLSVYHHSLCWN